MPAINLNNENLRILLISSTDNGLGKIPEGSFELSIACNLNDAIEMLKKNLKKEDKFDAIICCLNLPDSSAFDCVSKLYSLEPHIPIIILNSLYDDQIFPKVIELGAQDYLISETITLSELIKTIKASIARKKNEFLFKFGHELRTSLNAIIGTSELLAESKLDQEQAKYMAILKKAGFNLLHLIDDQQTISSEPKKQVFSAKILLADDSEINRILIQGYLKNTGHIITEAENGKIALDKYKLSSFDLILMDMEMPVMDGYTAIEEIRKWEKETNHGHTPVIAVTGYSAASEKEKILAAGCDFYLTKPILKENLIVALEKCIISNTSNVEINFFSIDDLFLRIAALNQTKAKEKNKKITIRVDPCLPPFVKGALSEIHELLQKSILNTMNSSDPGIIELVATRKSGNGLDLLVEFSTTCDGQRNSFEFPLIVIPSAPLEILEDQEEFSQKSRSIQIGDQKKILLIDDDEDNRFIIKAFLENHSLIFTECGNGEDAYDFFTKNSYDLVLLDMQMPGLDGYQVARMMRKWELLNNKKRTSIFAFSANSDPELIAKTLIAGCDYHISKPVREKEMLQILTHLARKY